MTRTQATALGVLGLLACTAQLERAPGSGAAGVAGSAGAVGTAGVAGTAVVQASDPGRVTLHRLNRAEYDNSVRDLLGTTLRPSSDFPIDDRGSGFDNMADVLTLSPLHLSTYHSAARALVTEALSNTAQRASVFSCDLTAPGDVCLRDAVRSFAYRAWRRLVTDAELERLVAVAAVARAQGEGNEVGLGLALRTVLLSPYFIFRVELDSDPTSAVPHPLNGYELAARLSYFLWSSTPDTPLLERAGTGTLSEPPVLEAEVARLLADPRSSSLVDNFAGQWLHLRAVDTLEPAATAFPSFDPALRARMRRESELLFRDVAFHGAPLTQLLTAGYSYLDDALAAHYGLPAPGSSEPVRVELGGNAERGGFLTHAGFLTLTSYPERTSPVVRGKWVMDELLCAAVPPPPADVDLGGVAMAKEQGLTQRQALERHRQDPKCIGCHQLMDPIGLGFENYDAVGAYRTMDLGMAIDSAGQLPSGEAFSGAKQLAAVLAAKPEFVRCAVKKLYTFALGRPPSDAPDHLDAATLDAIVQSFTESGYAWPKLVSGIALAPTFTQRRGEPLAGALP